jgi:hypothetical protein
VTTSTVVAPTVVAPTTIAPTTVAPTAASPRKAFIVSFHARNSNHTEEVAASTEAEAKAKVRERYPRATFNSVREK